MTKKLISEYLPLKPGIEQFSLDFIEHNRVIKLDEDAASISIGLCTPPLDRTLNKVLGNTFRGREIREVLIGDDDLTSFLGRELSKEKGEDVFLEGSERLEIDRLANDAPIINLVNSLLIDGVQKKASDIHFECFSEEAVVRFRIDGLLQVYTSFTRERFKAVSSRLKIMANLNIMETRKPQDGRFTVESGGLSLDIRISVVPIAKGESIVLRLLNLDSSAAAELGKLGFPERIGGDIRRLCSHPHGLILVTGPTGSGKTTTLNAMLNHIKSDTKKIITIEDPVEFVIDGIDQIQTNDEIGLSFSTLLRRVLRQDPDTIMVGEIRDKETAELAIRASLTGHLVLSTLHTNDAPSAITRLLNMGVPAYLTGSVIRGVIAQRLVRKLCSCKARRAMSDQERRLFGIGDRELTVYEPQGCEECGGSGYKGRTPIIEYFLNSKETEEVICEAQHSNEIIDHITRNGLNPFSFNALWALKQGMTSVSEIQRVVFFNAEI